MSGEEKRRGETRREGVCLCLWTGQTPLRIRIFLQQQDLLTYDETLLKGLVERLRCLEFVIYSPKTVRYIYRDSISQEEYNKSLSGDKNSPARTHLVYRGSDSAPPKTSECLTKRVECSRSRIWMYFFVVTRTSIQPYHSNHA